MARSRASAAPALFVAAALLSGCFAPEPAPYVPRDARLRAEPLWFYPSADSAAPPRAFVFFIGNDIGFWGAHQELAKRLASSGYDVVGFDVKAYYATLPEEPAARARAFAGGVAALITRSRTELHADSVPVVVAGHSIGAEVASWIAAHAPPPRLAGVLLISPGARGHLRVTVADLALSGEPTEAGSFSVADNLRAIDPSVRIALVRGTDDRYRSADSALLAAGGPRMGRWWVPWGGHSMRNILLAGPFVERALAWTLPQ